ncbi:DUF3139 domain-containing protein [Halalkalibacterium halodurans]|uniref:DUF3139 domain-containing protein n=1 Tax=Halalkalibacterium halodurans TaxID=86665 RepID=UPI002E204C8D|nr:DUF3139 domain-containing protein [Halalkalibacterium halodurans]MED4086789.1 DUF3139 domain-containing protein [Halalkalibacterium halodurans]MED4106275.1 DUF3139 domain-containing protein [Halalkalibacterium halodurans]MED4108853.1 DUF3139 domain-containing protein [Halalkalibacterium halodurans]MED4125167.1 DUF3139 domain-containing protein [Halalkalibacterium halodurans]
MKKKIIFLLISLILVTFIAVPFVLIYILNHGNPYEKFIVTKNVSTHLEAMGYTDDDLLNQSYIEPKYLINDSVYHGHYKVVFADEPHLEYLYGVTKRDKEVVQFCEKETFIEESSYWERTTEKTNHSEDECTDYMN